MSIRPIEWVRQTNSEKFKENFYKLKYYFPKFSYIGWNADTDSFSDRRVRLAMTHVINRKQYWKSSSSASERSLPGIFIFSARIITKKLNPGPTTRHARGNCCEAGWKDSDGDGILDRKGKKFSFTFTISSGRKFAERLGASSKEDFARVGIEMNINQYEWAVFVGKIQKREFEAVTLAWSLVYSDDPYQLWHSSQIKGGSNFLGFSNKEADRIIEKARMEFDEKKELMYRRFHEIIHYEQPYTFLFCSPALVVVSKKFTNVKVHLRGLNMLNGGEGKKMRNIS